MLVVQHGFGFGLVGYRGGCGLFGNLLGLLGGLFIMLVVQHGFGFGHVGYRGGSRLFDGGHDVRCSWLGIDSIRCDIQCHIFRCREGLISYRCSGTRHRHGCAAVRYRDLWDGRRREGCRGQGCGWDRYFLLHVLHRGWLLPHTDAAHLSHAAEPAP